MIGRMENSQFRMIVREIEKDRYIYVTGTVEEGSISVNDFIDVINNRGKRIKVRVERIVVSPGIALTTADSGSYVQLVLCGLRARRIEKGDILKTPKKGFRKTNTTIQFYQIFLLLFTFACLIDFICVYLLGNGKRDEGSINFWRQILFMIVASSAVYFSAFIVNAFFRHREKKSGREIAGRQGLRF